MRVLIHDYGAYAFSIQLARAFAQRGHAVRFAYSTGLVTPKGDVGLRADDPPLLSIEAIGFRGSATRRAGVRRLLEERQYGGLAARQVVDFQPEVVLSANAPLDVQRSLERAAHRGRSRFVFWMQDVYSEAVGRLIGRRSGLAGRLAGARFRRLEARIAREADAVVPVSSDFVPLLTEWGVAAEKITVLANWAPLEDVQVQPKDNALARELGLHNRSVLLYSGTLGRKHNPAMLVALAAALPEARIVVAAEGAGMEQLRRAEQHPPNLMLLPLQTPERYAQLLGAADILVALLEPDAATFSVPSKILTYIAAARPILAAIPAENLAARTITEAHAGFVVAPDDIAGFGSAASTLLRDAPMRLRLGENSRRYAVEKFAIAPIVDRFEGVLSGEPQPLESSAAHALGKAGG